MPNFSVYHSYNYPNYFMAEPNSLLPHLEF
jgi:hypothetical protein